MRKILVALVATIALLMASALVSPGAEAATRNCNFYSSVNESQANVYNGRLGKRDVFQIKNKIVYRRCVTRKGYITYYPKYVFYGIDRISTCNGWRSITINPGPIAGVNLPARTFHGCKSRYRTHLDYFPTGTKTGYGGDRRYGTSFKINRIEWRDVTVQLPTNLIR